MTAVEAVVENTGRALLYDDVPLNAIRDARCASRAPFTIDRNHEIPFFRTVARSHSETLGLFILPSSIESPIAPLSTKKGPEGP